MRKVALLAARLDEIAGLEVVEHAIEQQMLGLAGDKPLAELGKSAEVKAGIGQFEPERRRPVDPGAHRIRGLAVAQMLEKLEHRDQRQSPRRQSRLAAHREEGREIGVALKRAELVTQLHDDRALRKGGAGHANGLSGDVADRLLMKAHG